MGRCREEMASGEWLKKVPLGKEGVSQKKNTLLQEAEKGAAPGEDRASRKRKRKAYLRASRPGFGQGRRRRGPPEEA